MDEEFSAGGESRGRELGGVGPGIDAAEEGALFAKGGEGEFLGGGGEESGGVVAEDTGEDLRWVRWVRR